MATKKTPAVSKETKPKPDATREEKAIPEASGETKEMPAVTNEKKEMPAVTTKKKEAPPKGHMENMVMFGDKMIEIKPTKMKYQRDRTAAFYRLLELYP